MVVWASGGAIECPVTTTCGGSRRFFNLTWRRVVMSTVDEPAVMSSDVRYVVRRLRVYLYELTWLCVIFIPSLRFLITCFVYCWRRKSRSLSCSCAAYLSIVVMCLRWVIMDYESARLDCRPVMLSLSSDFRPVAFRVYLAPVRAS